MYRDAIKQLQDWKQRPERKPLIVRGARQVGKTWLLREFGRNNYQSVAYVNLDGNPQMQNLFDIDFDIERIVRGIEVTTGVDVVPGETLVVLDEIQEVPQALTALKYFYENRPDYHVAVAGSLLGVALHDAVSFPVGKVDFLDLYPLSFSEFLRAVGNDRQADLIDQPDSVEDLRPFHTTLLDQLRNYYIVGGMPEVVQRYAEDGNLLGVREVQRAIVDSYEQDFSKHAPVNVVPRIREVWDIIPAQLARENKKFVFRLIRHGARAKDYELAMLWLEDAGVVGRVTRVNKPGQPLKAYEDGSAFKLFMNDVGLLGAKSGLDPRVVLDNLAVFQEFKGALAEQFVYQELRRSGVDTFYFSDEDSRGEIDFIVSLNSVVTPVEVKAEDNLQAKALKAFVGKYHSDYAVKLSSLPYRQNTPIVNVPLYLAGSLRYFIG